MINRLKTDFWCQLAVTAQNFKFACKLSNHSSHFIVIIMNVKLHVEHVDAAWRQEISKQKENLLILLVLQLWQNLRYGPTTQNTN